MKAAFIHHINQPLEIRDVSLPKSRNGYKSVKVLYAGLNHRDVWISKGQYAGIKLPIIPGSDLIGLLENRKVIVNPAFNWGDNEKVQSRGFSILGLPENGSLAEFTLVPETNIFPSPEHLEDYQSASLPLAGLTAYRSLITKGNAQKGEHVFISGIGGGVALYAMQFSLALGCKVFVSSSSQSKIETAISMGASGGVNYQQENWESTLVDMSNGIDLVIDGAGGAGFNKLLKVMNPSGRICIYGGTQGLIQNISPQNLFWKQISIYGSTMGSPSDFENMLKFVNTHKIVPIIDSVFNLDQVNDAFQRMNNGLQFGKIVIQIGEK
ncbi:MAG: zinc-binding dehydrogenase [Saprospiraceae bacterium]|nr:zinc-binding dehydrogenase [Saprospiraceae bacterium]